MCLPIATSIQYFPRVPSSDDGDSCEHVIDLVGDDAVATDGLRLHNEASPERYSRRCRNNLPIKLLTRWEVQQRRRTEKSEHPTSILWV